MKVEIVAVSSPYRVNIENEFNKMAGEFAGICYMPDTFDKVIAQPLEKKLKRAEMTKKNNHHSVFDHEYVTLYIENVPKLFAMLLNNEKMYTTSEKSARYTKMAMEGTELDLYQKWEEIFIKLITDKYGKVDYFNPKRIEKLAQENARYFLSVYTPTSLAYTTSYGQLSRIYGWLKDMENTENPMLKKLVPTAKDFCTALEVRKLVVPEIAEYGSMRGFSLIAPKEREEYFGDVYCTKYLGSFSSLAQAQRHRTTNYELKELEKPLYYVPKIIRENEALRQEWLNDMQKVKDVTPQGKMVEIIERGTPENFILKMRERLCTCAQLEIQEQTKHTLEKYINQVKDEQTKKILEQYNHGARCTAGYKCTSPCGFKEGVDMTREI